MQVPDVIEGAWLRARLAARRQDALAPARLRQVPAWLWSTLACDRSLVAALVWVAGVRLLVWQAAFIGANRGQLEDWPTFDRAVPSDPHVWPGLWQRWDAEHYLTIATYGYSHAGIDVGFLPGYPLVVHVLAIIVPVLSVVWLGVIVSNLSFLGANLLLWSQVSRGHGPRAAFWTLMALSLFPTSVFFSAIYTESLFLLLSVATYTLSRNGKYYLAAMCVALASVTRLNGTLLGILVVVEIWQNEGVRAWRKLILVSLIAGAGLVAFGIYSALTQGSVFAYATATSQHWRRVTTWPWQTVGDSLAVLATVSPSGDKGWMWVGTVQDFGAVVLFALLAVGAAFVLRASLTIYLLTGLLYFLTSNGAGALGVWSHSRYVLGLFPGFLVAGVLLRRYWALRWLVLGVWVPLLAYLAWRWGNGRWVA